MIQGLGDSKYDPFTTDEEREFTKKYYKSNYDLWLTVMIERNLRLLYYISGKYEVRTEDHDDLFIKACEYAALAARRYDPEKHDVRFGSYVGTVVGFHLSNLAKTYTKNGGYDPGQVANSMTVPLLDRLVKDDEDGGVTMIDFIGKLAVSGWRSISLDTYAQMASDTNDYASTCRAIERMILDENFTVDGNVITEKRRKRMAHIFHELYANGLTVSEVAAKMTVSRTSIWLDQKALQAGLKIAIARSALSGNRDCQQYYDMLKTKEVMKEAVINVGKRGQYSNDLYSYEKRIRNHRASIGAYVTHGVFEAASVHDLEKEFSESMNSTDAEKVVEDDLYHERVLNTAIHGCNDKEEYLEEKKKLEEFMETRSPLKYTVRGTVRNYGEAGGFSCSRARMKIRHGAGLIKITDERIECRGSGFATQIFAYVTPVVLTRETLPYAREDPPVFAKPEYGVNIPERCRLCVHAPACLSYGVVRTACSGCRLFRRPQLSEDAPEDSCLLSHQDMI